jgi:SAM-dependent methyltransferase
VEQYVVEKELAERLRSAAPERRAETYGEVYNELFTRFPDHPQFAIDRAERARFVQARWRFVSRFLTANACVMEIGAGDCAFSVHAAQQVRKVVAVDVSEVIVSGAPENLEVIISDGTSIPVEPASVDLVFSDQLMEHLHPDDAAQQLENVARAIRPGGVYVCITPNRVTGPHDVSRGFDEVSTGFHLREYRARDLAPMFVNTGFSKVDFYAGGRGRYVRLPHHSAIALESAFEWLPLSVRWRLSGAAYPVLGLNVVAYR